MASRAISKPKGELCKGIDRQEFHKVERSHRQSEEEASCHKWIGTGLGWTASGRAVNEVP